MPAEANALPPSNDPIGDLAGAIRCGDLASGRAPASAGTDPFMYFVQAGAFRTPEDAEAQRAKLSLMGVEAKVTEREQAGRTGLPRARGPVQQEGRRRPAARSGSTAAASNRPWCASSAEPSHLHLARPGTPRRPRALSAAQENFSNETS